MSRKKSSVTIVHEYTSQGLVDDLNTFLKTLSAEEASSVCKEEFPRKGTALHVASNLGNVSIVKLLVETYKADVNYQLTEGFVVSGQSPLHEACAGGHIDVVKYLIAKGANPNAREQDGQSPLHSACMGRNLDVFKLLLESGADIDAPDNKGQTPLQMSILRTPFEFTECLIEKGADVHILDKDGQSPLHYAVEWDDIELVRMLLNMNVNVNIQDNHGRTPLHSASQSQEISNLLLENGADPEIRDNYGQPPVLKKLDIQKEEYQAIDNALSQHLKVAEKRPANAVEVARVQEKMNKLRVAGDAGVKSAKANVMSELLSKRNVQEDERENNSDYKKSPLAAAGVHGELMAKMEKSSN